MTTTRKTPAVLACCANQHRPGIDIVLRREYPISDTDKVRASLWYCDYQTKLGRLRFSLAADKLRDFLTVRMLTAETCDWCDAPAVFRGDFASFRACATHLPVNELRYHAIEAHS